MREHQIRSRSTGFVEDEYEEVTRESRKAAKPPQRVTTTEEIETAGPSINRMIGQAAVRTGIAILAVPDPIPVVDEVAGIALIAGGTYLIATS